MVADGEALCTAGEGSLLLRLMQLIDALALAPEAPRRGRPWVYDERLFLKAVVVMVVRHLPNVHAFLAALEQPELRAVRAQLCDRRGRFPTRRTWERRLQRVPAELPAQIAALGARLRARLDPWAASGRAAAVDSMALHARGRVWHQRDRKAGKLPDTRIDPDAHWTRSGWHGWVYGYKLHVVVTVSDAVWLPLAADLTPANVADNTHAAVLLDAWVQADGAALAELFLLADSAYQDKALQKRCAQHGMRLLASRRGAYPHGDAGAPVRALFHQLRTHAIENWNGQFKAIFDCRAQVPTRGLVATRRAVLGAVYVYQLTLLDRFLAGRSLRVGLKPALQAA